MNIGIIDVGSNTMRLSIYKIKNNNSFDNIMNKKEMVGLAGYIEDGKMSESGINRAIETLLKFKEIALEFHIERIHVLATAPFRNIENTEECIRRINESTGLAIDAISGEKEAELDFSGALLGNELNDGLLIDIGGGSTELVCFKEKKILQAISLPIGSLSAYNRFFKTLYPTKKAQNELKEHVENLLKIADFMKTQDTRVIIGVGGTIRACNKIFMRAHALKNNNAITNEEVKEVVQLVKNMQGKNLDMILKTCPDRIHTILPGMIILKTIIKRFGGENIIISHYGVREGYLAEQMAKGEYNA